MASDRRGGAPDIALLYVDDEPALLHIGKIYLELSKDIRVTTAESAAEALALVSAQSFDAIVSDYLMPGMNGIEFLKTLRSSGNSLPFIIFTGRGREEVVIEALNAGADFYLQKGGDPRSQFAELAHKVRVAIARRRAEFSLVESEKRLADIINFLPDATFAIDRSGSVIAWNRAIEEMTGVPAADMLGRGDYEYAIPFYGERRKILIDLIFEPDEVIATRYANIIHEKDILIADTSLPRPRGMDSILMGKASPLYNRKGDIVGAIESIRDITAVKRADEELRAANEQLKATEDELRERVIELTRSEQRITESESKFREFAEMLPQIVFEIDREYRVTFVNHQALASLGYTAEDMRRGFPALSIIDPAQHDRIAANVEKIVAGEKIEHVEYTVTRKDGSTFPALVYVNPVKQGENVTGLRGIIIDISARKRAEEAIGESEEKFRTLFNHVNDAIYIHELNPDGSPGRFLEVNDILCRRLGYTRAELLTMSVADILSDEQKRKILEIGTRILSSGVYTFEAEHRRRDGSTYTAEVNSCKVAFQGKDAVLSAARDITQRKFLENDIRDANRKLNILNSITRHDVTNQLTIIRGYTRLAADAGPGPEVASCLARIETTVGTIDGQIEFARIYQDLGIKAPAWSRVDEIVRKATRPEVRIADGCDSYEIYADPMIERVFSNLFDNAARHGKGVTRITVSCRESPGILVVSVEDDGEGIPPEEKEMIFLRGYGKNSGFGLFLAREILAITDISIQETGMPGSGALFEIAVPHEAFRVVRE